MCSELAGPGDLAKRLLPWRGGAVAVSGALAGMPCGLCLGFAPRVISGIVGTHEVVCLFAASYCCSRLFLAIQSRLHCACTA